MGEYDLKRRTKRASTSVAANYRAACRPRSTDDFIAKLCIVEEEADESIFWLEIIDEFALADRKAVAALLDEGDPLVAITVASIRTARRNRADRPLRKKR